VSKTRYCMACGDPAPCERHTYRGTLPPSMSKYAALKAAGDRLAEADEHFDAVRSEDYDARDEDEWQVRMRQASVRRYLAIAAYREVAGD